MIAKITNRVQIKKNIIRETIKNIEDLNNFVTKVGFNQGGKVGTPIKSGDKPALSSMSEVSQIATKLEFGPVGKKRKSWPFMTQSFADGVPKVKSLINQTMPLIIDGKLDAFRALGLYGELHQDQIKTKIRDMKSPPLEQVTIDKKKSSNPLIDTGQMIQSVGHVEGKR
ncbi:MAG: hypothetical protein V3V00_16025 [Saprospiraceae bacterium]